MLAVRTLTSKQGEGFMLSIFLMETFEFFLNLFITLELPIRTAHWTLLLSIVSLVLRLGFKPFHNTVHVETVRAFSQDWRAVVSWNEAIWTGRIERLAADSANCFLIFIFFLFLFRQ